MADFCYSFPVFNRVLAQSEVMDRVMARLGVNPLDAIRQDQGAAWYEARTRCIDCAVDRQCRLWLERMDEHAMDGPACCPNRAFFGLCRKKDGRNDRLEEDAVGTLSGNQRPNSASAIA